MWSMSTSHFNNYKIKDQISMRDEKPFTHSQVVNLYREEEDANRSKPLQLELDKFTFNHLIFLSMITPMWPSSIST
jgi:hypothetical protein